MSSADTRRRPPGPTLTGTTECHRRRGRGDGHLWSERGFEATGRPDIVDCSAVSVRSLLRHVSSQADLPWVGVERPTAEIVRWLGFDPLVTVGCEGGTG